MMATIAISNDTSSVREKISDWLSEATREAGFHYAPVDITLVLTDDSGKMIGGLTGATQWNWLYIETLAVAPEHRNQGHARRLVARAEEIAGERGCYGCWVDTFSFQVPNFYIELGYEQFAELPSYPADESRIFLRKILHPTSNSE